MDLTNLKAVTRSNSEKLETKVKGERHEPFSLKYTQYEDKNNKITHKFAFSKGEFSRLNLSSLSLALFMDDNTTCLGTVDGKEGIILRNTNKNEGGVKSKVFKSSNLEKALFNSNDLSDELGYQKLKLISINKSIDVAGYHVFELFRVEADTDVENAPKVVAGENEEEI